MTRLRPGKLIEATDPIIGEVRELSRADLSHLTEKRPPNSIQTLRDNHHRMARALAAGLTTADAAKACGVSISRITSLRSDPSFADLVAHYRALVTAEWVQEDTVIEMMRGNALKAQAMLSDKLDDAMEKNEFLSTRDLLGIAEQGLDRTGYGKERKNVNINMDFAARLEEARKRSATAREVSGRVIESKVAHATPGSQSRSAVAQLPSRDLPTSSLRRL